MLIDLPGATIKEIISVIPETSVSFVKTAAQYGIPKSKAFKMKEVFGFDTRRVALAEETAADFACHGLADMVEKGLDVCGLGAIIFVGQTPDYLMPGSSYLVHGSFGFSQDTLCIDVNQGCNGFIYGLLLAYQLVSLLGGKDVLLINGDTLSHHVSEKDFKIQPLIGDATTLVIISQDKLGAGKFLIRSDGARAAWLTIPAGGTRTPRSAETSVLAKSSDGCERSPEHFTMNGAGVFSFTQTNVPEMINDLFEQGGFTTDDIQRYFFHQPNTFLVKKLAQTLKIPLDRIPHKTVNDYGNISGASIPHTICLSHTEHPLDQVQRCCLSGFGVGLSWGAVITNIGPLKRAEVICKPVSEGKILRVTT